MQQDFHYLSGTQTANQDYRHIDNFGKPHGEKPEVRLIIRITNALPGRAVAADFN